MARYVGRDGNNIDWTKVSDNYPFGSSAYNDVYGVNDVIDIMFLGYNGVFYSVRPDKFRSQLGSNLGESSTGYTPNCGGDSNVPISAFYLNRSQMTNLCKKAVDDGAGGWHNNSETMKLETAGMTSSIDLAGIGLLDDKKGKTIYSNTKCTEFSILFNRISALSNAMAYHGYELFNPDNYTHKRNWIRYESSNNKHDSYMLVLYLTMPKLLLEQKFLQTSDLPSPIKDLIKLSTSDNAVINLVKDRCTKPLPDGQMTRLSSYNYYYMGTTIYSSDSRYKLVIQADGNVVVYQTGGKAVWTSNTSSANYIFPKVAMEKDGAFIIWGRNGASTRISGSYGVKTYLSIDSNSGILVIREQGTNNIKWSSASIQDIYRNDYGAYNTFQYQSVHKASDSERIFSPNMKYFVRFAADGNLVLYNNETRSALWSTSTNGNPNAVLAILTDGNVVIYKDATKASILWRSGTGGFNNTTFIAVDNNGYIVIFGHDKTGLHVRWSSAPKPQYYSLSSGLQSSKLSNDPLAFTRACTSAKYNKTLEQSALLEAQAAWCGSGLNILDNKCSKFIVGGVVSGDNSSQDIKKKYIDTYVKDSICSDGYNTRYSADSGLQTKINKLCSCINPTGDALKLLRSGVHPKCYEQNCAESGYKSIASESIECPKCLCVQEMNLKNLQLASNVQQTCSANCTNIGENTMPVIASTELPPTTPSNIPPTTPNASPELPPITPSTTPVVPLSVEPSLASNELDEGLSTIAVISIIIGVITFLFLVIIILYKWQSKKKIIARPQTSGPVQQSNIPIQLPFDPSVMNLPVVSPMQLQISSTPNSFLPQTK